ncbi:DNA-binding protein [Lachnoclostridium sp. An169]|uniref:carbon-phosphorus lyase complex subunit PhnI n=1 Tax=Lachnoclostridium sp. An169 TaxID=1965569 RepID=UPI000B388EA5|nr:carbon-phosphorus lyase complex subunit PhnI [Lachnoclostridium sp. An169]OUP81597.1 DNA-binding protein [Lachnoclostridium sp. An169]
MAYVAVTGGREAIEQSLKLLEIFRESGEDITISCIKENMGLLIDKIMSEAGFYSRDYAALALKQCEGSVEEAVFLLRAYRSTLPRNYYSNPVDTSDMRLIRRISAAFKDIPGGQILGPTYDYSHRLLNFSLMDDGDLSDSAVSAVRNGSSEEKLSSEDEEELSEDAEISGGDIRCGRVTDLLKADGVMAEVEQDDTEPFDVTSNLLTFPAPRSARLQTFARSDAGFLGGVAYSSMRGYGAVHPTVSELRCGYVEVCVPYVLDEEDEICIGEILVTEVEALVPSHTETDEDFDKMTLSGGYGLIFGRNENKAIAMSIADASLETTGDSPSQDEEFVLTHGDCLEMSGFISHLKLPHYVTFQSSLDRVRAKGEKR